MCPGEIAHFLVWSPLHLPFGSCYVRAPTSPICPVRSHKPPSLPDGEPLQLPSGRGYQCMLLAPRHRQGARFLKPHANLAVASQGGPSAKSALHHGEANLPSAAGSLRVPREMTRSPSSGFLHKQREPDGSCLTGDFQQFPHFLAHSGCSVNLSVRFSPSLLFRGPPPLALQGLTLGGAAGEGLGSHCLLGSS